MHRSSDEVSYNHIHLSPDWDRVDREIKEISEKLAMMEHDAIEDGVIANMTDKALIRLYKRLYTEISRRGITRL